MQSNQYCPFRKQNNAGPGWCKPCFKFLEATVYIMADHPISDYSWWYIRLVYYIIFYYIILSYLILCIYIICISHRFPSYFHSMSRSISHRIQQILDPWHRSFPRLGRLRPRSWYHQGIWINDIKNERFLKGFHVDFMVIKLVL